jgi:hypothetical protein
MAATLLQKKGYTTVKSATRSWPYDLVAFSEHHTLLIAARRHTVKQSQMRIAQVHKELILDMQQTKTPSYTEKQLWIYQNGHGFSIYKLFPAGIMKTEI